MLDALGLDVFCSNNFDFAPFICDKFADFSTLFCEIIEIFDPSHVFEIQFASLLFEQIRTSF